MPSEEDWKEEQMNAGRYLVDAELDNLGVFKTTDLLDRLDRFAATLTLHGTLSGNLLPESRAETAAAYFDALDASLKEKALESVKESIYVPEEFSVLARHVLGINGPVWPGDMTKYTVSFWRDNGIWEQSKIPARVTRPEDLEFAWEIDEKVALIWDPGMVLEGNSSCLYIPDSVGTWTWIFGWRWQGDERTLDNIPELFKWYFWTLESDFPNLDDLSAEAVVNRIY